MAYLLSRAAARARLRTESHTPGNTAGPGDDARLNEVLNYSLAHTWEWLSSTDQGFGVRSLVETVSAADADGYVPGATSVALPVDFRRVVEIKRGQGFPDLVSHSESLWRTPSGPPGWYLIDGPGQTVDALTGALVATPQTMKFAPALQDGEVITLLYAQQPPTWGDPAIPTNAAQAAAADAVSLDLVGDGVVRLVIARAWVIQTPREDNDNYERAAADYALAQSEYMRTVSQRSGGILRLSRYKKPRGGR
jgi:hypothetical protein